METIPIMRNGAIRRRMAKITDALIDANEGTVQWLQILKILNSWEKVPSMIKDIEVPQGKRSLWQFGYDRASEGMVLSHTVAAAKQVVRENPNLFSRDDFSIQGAINGWKSFKESS